MNTYLILPWVLEQLATFVRTTLVIHFLKEKQSLNFLAFSSEHIRFYDLKSHSWKFPELFLSSSSNGQIEIFIFLKFISINYLSWCQGKAYQLALKKKKEKKSNLIFRHNYHGHLMQRVGSLEKTLMLGRIWGRRRRGRQRMRWLDGSLTQWMWVWVNSESWWWTGRPGVLQSMGLQRVGHD